MTDGTTPLITIVTPTYNRRELLHRLKDSLTRQGAARFAWLVVDDGSSDGTAELLQQWESAGFPFEFSWISQPNGGKHRALNTALRRLVTPWYMVVDSDDWLIDGVLQDVVLGWLSPGPADPRVVGVAGLRLYPDGGPIGGVPHFPGGQSFVDCSNLERFRFKLMGDKAEIYRSEVARSYPFPEFDGEKFVEEALVGDAMAADGCLVRWYSQGVYYCDYQNDGLSARIDAHHADSFEGYTAYAQQYVRLHRGAGRFMLIGVYVDTARGKGLSPSQAAARLGVTTFSAVVAGFTRRAAKALRPRGRLR